MTDLIVDPESQTIAPSAPDAPTPEVVKADVPEIQEKYRGKTVEELIEMHRQAESEIGRTRNEIGHVRRLADELIGIRAAEVRAAANPPNQAPVQPITTDQLLDKPEESIVAVARREAQAIAREATERTANLEVQLATERFEKKHSNYKTVMVSPEFAGWVRKSPYRGKLALRASKGDLEAADELFTLYEEVASTPTPSPQPASGVQAARQATTAKPGGSSAAGVVPAGDGKKVWSRAELLEMRLKRPDEFDSRQDEILQAYREKRVR